MHFPLPLVLFLARYEDSECRLTCKRQHHCSIRMEDDTKEEEIIIIGNTVIMHVLTLLLQLITVDETFKARLEFQVTTEDVQRNLNNIAM